MANAEPQKGGEQLWGKLKRTKRTFLLHPQPDVLGDQNRVRKEAKLKSAKNVALVDPAVIVGNVEDSDGEVLQVLAPVPEQTASKRSIQLGRVVILEPVNLKGGDGACETHWLTTQEARVHSWDRRGSCWVGRLSPFLACSTNQLASWLWFPPSSCRRCMSTSRVRRGPLLLPTAPRHTRNGLYGLKRPGNECYSSNFSITTDYCY